MLTFGDLGEQADLTWPKLNPISLTYAFFSPF